MEPIIAKWTSLEKDSTGKYRPMVKLPDGRHMSSKEYRATHVDTRKDDPEWVERRNAHTRKYAANKKATDPNWPEHRRILMNNYYNSHKDDPEFREKRNTYNRMARLKKKMEATNEI